MLRKLHLRQKAQVPDVLRTHKHTKVTDKFRLGEFVIFFECEARPALVPSAVGVTYGARRPSDFTDADKKSRYALDFPASRVL